MEEKYKEKILELLEECKDRKTLAAVYTILIMEKQKSTARG